MLVVDLSNVNGAVDFKALKAAGVGGVICKATEGLTFNDALFNQHRADAALHGLRFGAYHFARPDHNSPVSEAKHFVAVVKKVGRRDFKPTLDLEVTTKMTPVELATWVKKFNVVVKNNLGCWPMFYSYSAYIRRMNLSRPVGSGLWLASYGRNDGKEYPFEVPDPWQRVVCHQFTSTWRVAGHSGLLDLSHVLSLRGMLAHPIIGRL